MLARVAALVDRTRAIVRERATGSKRALGVLLVVATTVSSAHLARLGTHSARIATVALIALALLAATLLALREVWAFRDRERALLREVARDDVGLSRSIARAIGLSRRSERSPDDDSDRAATMARDLADLHLSRQLAKVRLDRLEQRADKTGVRAAGAALSLAVLAMAATMFDPLRVVEGLDVLAARDGVAPLRLVYLDDVDVVVTPPAYLGLSARSLPDFDTTEVPRGSVIAVRGKPVKAGRSLVLTDGITEVDFVDDGKGMLVARYTLGESALLRVAARFGSREQQVRVLQRDELWVESLPDLPPVVTLKGAPATTNLSATPQINLEYEAKDDHALREVAVVLRSGKNEDRRTLSKPLGSKVVRGAHVLSSDDQFFFKSFVPIEVTIEAKDDDGVQGPKWGTSQALIIMPPLVGEPEALRYAALKRARDALVDLLAARLEPTITSDQDAKARVNLDKELALAASAKVEKVLAEAYGGLTISGRVRRVIAGQLRRLSEAREGFEKKPTQTSYEALIATTEQVVLAVDAAIRRAATSDARAVAKRLAAVADEAALASQVAADGAQRERGLFRLAAALEVLGRGGAQLARLSTLGSDLGDVTRSGVSRIERERGADRLPHAKLAAEDLAARLRSAESSMKGGGGGHGVESGVGDGDGMGEEASEADEQAVGQGNELDELVKRHQQELDRVEQALDKATTKEEKDALKKLAKKHAEAIREAVKDLPDQGLPGSADELGALGKKRAASMAGDLDKGAIKEALTVGKDALEALRQAKKLGEKGKSPGDEDVAEVATKAGNRVEEALEDLKKALDAAEKSAKERAKKDLDDAGKNEGRLAERTEALKNRGEKGDASMPQDVLDQLERAAKAMRQAEEALKEGDVETGKAKQKAAQRLLEMAKGEDAEEEGSRGSGGEKGFDQDTAVPGEEEHKGPEEFRKRVTDGMGKAGDARLRGAAKRYAEGLLK